MKRKDLLAARTAAEKISELLGESSTNNVLMALIMANSAERALLFELDKQMEETLIQESEAASRQASLFEELEGSRVAADKVRNIVLASMNFDGEHVEESPFDLGRRACIDGLTHDENPHRADTPEAAQWAAGFEFARPKYPGAKQAKPTQTSLPIAPEPEVEEEDDSQARFGLTAHPPGTDIAIETLSVALAEALDETGSELIVTTDELAELTPEERLEVYEWANARSGNKPAALAAIEWAQTIVEAIEAKPVKFSAVSGATSAAVLRAWTPEEMPAVGASFARADVSPEVLARLVDELSGDDFAEADGGEADDDDPQPIG